MDSELLAITEKTMADTGKKGIGIREGDIASGELLVESPSGTISYRLKPLSELYGNGVDAPLTTDDERFHPLLMAIEERIYAGWRSPDRTTEGQVMAVLKQLGMSPESPPGDPLTLHLQYALRLCLSVNDYSRQNLKAAIKRIIRSVEFHLARGGPGAYFRFLHDFFDKLK